MNGGPTNILETQFFEFALYIGATPVSLGGEAQQQPNDRPGGTRLLNGFEPPQRRSAGSKPARRRFRKLREFQKREREMRFKVVSNRKAMLRNDLHTRLTSPERQALASDPGTTPNDLANLTADGNLQVRRAAALNHATPSKAIDLLVAAGATRDLTCTQSTKKPLAVTELNELIDLGEWGRFLVASHPSAGINELERLARDPLTSVRQKVASHTRCSPILLAGLCGDANPQVRVSAAKHPSTPPETVAQLVAAGSTSDLSGYASDGLDSISRTCSTIDFAVLFSLGPWGRQLAARHPNVEPERLQSLAEDSDWSVRAAVAENPAANSELLSALVGLDVFEVKLRVAEHPHTSAIALARLVDEADTRLRVSVASNPNAPSALLRRLACDGAAMVRERVAAHANFSEEDRWVMVAAGSAADLVGFATPNPELDAQVIAELAQLGDWGRRLAARHPKTSQTTLEQLLTSGDPTLREAAFVHPARPRTLLTRLATTGSSEDLQGFAPPKGSLSPDTTTQFLRLGPWARRLLARHPQADTHSLGELANDTDPQTRREVARHPHAPPSILVRLASDISHEVRWSLVNRVSLTAPALEVLLRDSIATIRVAAVEHHDTPIASLDLVRFDLDEDVRAALKTRRQTSTP